MSAEVEIEGRDGSDRRVVYVDRDVLTIGRAEENDLVLAGVKVSGHHARLSKKDSHWKIEDLGSTNGTFIDGFRIEGVVSMKAGVRFEIGDHRLRVAEEPLKARIHKRLVEFLDLRWVDLSKLPEEEVRAQTERTIGNILREMAWEIPRGLDRDTLIKEIIDEALGLGPLEELLADESISEIMVNRADRIYIERNGKLVLSDRKFTSNQAVLAAIERIVAPIGRRIDESSPLVDARLKDGSRVNAIIPPLALKGPCITIRKFGKNVLGIDQLVEFKALSRGMASFMKLAVEERQNVVVSGGTGSGKTTLLNVLSSFIPEDERIVTVEDSAELQLRQDHLITLETRPPNVEGTGAITIRDLVRNSLRMRPDRVVIGECRGGEALDMLQAMNTGHDGSMTTLHSNSPIDAIARMETLVLLAGVDLPIKAIRDQIAGAVNFILQQTRFHDGTRKITAISEVTGIEDGQVTLEDVFLFHQDGYDENHRVRGRHMATGYIPQFYQELRARGLPVDLTIFGNEEK